jgi:hypothetical protein
MLVKQASAALADSIHANAIEVGSCFFRGLCYNSTSKLLSPVGAVSDTAI